MAGALFIDTTLSFTVNISFFCVFGRFLSKLSMIGSLSSCIIGKFFGGKYCCGINNKHCVVRVNFNSSAVQQYILKI